MSRVGDAIAALRGRPIPGAASAIESAVEHALEQQLGNEMVKWANSNGLAASELVKVVREGGTIRDLSEIAAGRQPLDPTMGAPWAANDPQFNTGQMGPGSPAQAFPLGGEPRLWQYRVGRNFATPPDADRNVDAQLLRTLADSYDLLRKCIEVMKSEITALEWDIVPTEKNRKKREQWIADNGDDLERIKQFFLWPEAYTTRGDDGSWVRRGTMSWERWLGALLEDYYVGDFLTIWPRRMMNGELLGFERVDGSTIKPIIDLEGRIPPPPLPAYQQYLFGVPRASFTVEELLYRPRTVRNNTVYGFSHVEQMLVLINLCLRFQMWNTQGYTESSLPLGLLEFPENFTPDQINEVIDVLNATISGLANERQQFHGVPFGTKWNPIKPFEWDESFAQYLIEYTCALFGLNAQKLGFMPARGGQGLGGSGFAQQQAENTNSHELIPTARWVQSLMNELIERFFGRNDVRFQFLALDDQDEAELLKTNQEALFSGQKSLDEILQEAGEEPVGVDRFIVIGNLPWSIGDLKAIQEGEPRTAAPGLPAGDDLEPPPTVDGAGGPVPPDGGGSGDDTQRDRPARADARDTAGSPAKKNTAEQKPEPQDESDGDARKAAELAKTFDTSSGFQPHGLAGPRERVEELRRWKRKATKDAREGRPPRPFRSDVLPDEMKTAIAEELAHVTVELDGREVARVVGKVFEPHIEKAAHPVGPEGLEWAHYRRATFARETCGTCSFFASGVCAMFNQPVDVEHVCDEWAARPRYVTLDEARAAGRKAAETEQTVEVAGLVVLADDTGRVLMLQRSILDEDDPAAGTWEFPGGHLEDNETPMLGAIREWQEETGAELPPGEFRGGWQSGIYQAFIFAIPHEADVAINTDPDTREVLNPDDPDGDNAETVAWWNPADLPGMPALRPEVEDGADWAAIDRATPAEASEKAALPRSIVTGSRKDRTAVHERVGEAAVNALLLAKRRQARHAATPAEARSQLQLNQAEVNQLGRDLARPRTDAYLAGAALMLQKLGKQPLDRAPAADQLTIDQRADFAAQRFANAYHDELAKLAGGEEATPDNVIDGVARFQRWKAHQTAVSNATGGYNTGAISVANREGLASLIWATEHDDRVCPACDDRDGQVFSTVDATVMGDEGLHPGCRCEWELNGDALGGGDL